MDFPTGTVFYNMDVLVRKSGTRVSSICDPDTKRHAVYFPPNTDLAAQIRMEEFSNLEDEDDETSSFIFRAPRSVERGDKENAPLPNVVTPAQEIVNQYRARYNQCDAEEIPSPSPSSPSSTLRSSISGESTACSEENEQSILDFNCKLTVPKIRFRQSRFDALNEARAEAFNEMEKLGVSEDHPLVCPRSDCRETLSNVHTLTFHLHLHDVNKKTYKCVKCKATFKTRRERKSHSCGMVRCKSAPVSPIYATFGTILSKITSLN